MNVQRFLFNRIDLLVGLHARYVLPYEAPQLRMAHAEGGRRELGVNGRVLIGVESKLLRHYFSSHVRTCNGMNIN